MKTSRFEIYKDKRGKWRWRVSGDNNEIVGASSQGFATKKLCMSNAGLLLELLKPQFPPYG